MKKWAVERPPIFPVHRINGTDIVPRCAECYKPYLAKPSPIGSFGIVSDAPVTGPKKGSLLVSMTCDGTISSVAED